MADINSTAPSIRDYLLGRNLILSDTVLDNGMQGMANGLGRVASIEAVVPSVEPSVDIEDDGEHYRNLNTITNDYQNTDGYERIDIRGENTGGNSSTPLKYGTPSTANLRLGGEQDEIREDQLTANLYSDPTQQELIDLSTSPVVTSSQKRGYLDENNNLNTGGAVADQPLNILGTFLTGRDVGLNQGGGLEANFDIRASLAGRALTGIGAFNDTPIGVIGAQQLGFNLRNNLAFGLQQETIDRINTNPLSLLQGNDIFVQNYSITVPQGQLGRVLDFGARVLGFELPVSILSDSSSIFSSENPIGNIERANSLVTNSGRGQVLTLFTNMRQNKYQPAFNDDRIKDDGLNPSLYAFQGNKEGEVVDLINVTVGSVLQNPNNVGLTASTQASSEFELTHGNITTELAGGFNNDFDDLNNLGVNAPDGATKYSWGDEKANKPALDSYSNDVFTVKKGILSKTQALFNSNRMRTLVSGKGIIANADEIQTGIAGVGSSSYISKGSAVKSQAALEGNTTDPEEIFCRAWTTFDRYNTVNDLQKHSGLNVRAGIRKRTEFSVLDDNGFVRIAPKIGDDIITDGQNTMNRFMFSIENLAWADNLANLPPCEVGPGDLTTGTRGRIMWFPPYDIDFTDNSSVNWDSTNFIGRGEPIYTYNNTERTGTLQFKLIVDHSAVLNDMRDASLSDDEFASIIAGCSELPDSISNKLTPNEVNQMEVDTATQLQEKIIEPQREPDPLNFYFSNDNAIFNELYEDGIGGGLGQTFSDGHTNKAGTPFPDNTDFGLNATVVTTAFKDELKAKLRDECPACRIEIVGRASVQGNVASNQSLSDDRATNIEQWFTDNILEVTDELGSKRFSRVVGEGQTGCQRGEGESQDESCLKEARVVEVRFVFDVALAAELQEETIEPIETPPLSVEPTQEFKSRFFNECDYFEKIKQEDRFIYERFSEKLKFFHPAFHSTTPEGFNSRLNFLLQCTRQGRTGDGVRNPDNLAFGKPPVCILRVGDFYHTKIVIDNVAFAFDPLVWDLNPEGIGVQPMIATVDLSFKFIGGSSLNGPINRLQNAVSFNFFANTEIYDTRADVISGSTFDGFQLVRGDTDLYTQATQGGDAGVDLLTPKQIKDQEAANNDELNNNTETTPDAGQEDLELLSITRADGNSLFVEFTIEIKPDGSALSKDYTMKNTILSSDGVTEYTMSNNEALSAVDGAQQFQYDVGLVAAENGVTVDEVIALFTPTESGTPISYVKSILNEAPSKPLTRIINPV